ncbi:MAG: dTDP-4-dehydrorhamnose reductase [Candidatus Borkfalkiaceae bacterium]|nr:dTDP-4-dehydrorhamnose reductase [Clostridia bacterium]MDY6223596.1 dTDP-4-dehydrorhamnose reductase [Christensenellaceae bacterium]
MRILVTGAKGQLGFDVVNETKRRGHIVRGVDVEEMDVTDREAVRRVIGGFSPDAVIHCAAWTAVDAAEEQKNAGLVEDINTNGTAYIAEACKAVGAKIMYISTDYVFDGTGEAPWQPDCKAYRPLSVYGKTKLGGELAVKNTLDNFFIVRIAWVFGAHGNNFVKTMLKLGETHSSLRVVNDQIGTPTYTFDLARLLADMIETEKYGYYHATNEGGYISWADFAREIFLQAKKNVTVVPVTTAEYGLSKALRPLNSRLDKNKLIENGFLPLPDWKDALKRYLKQTERENGAD